MKNSLNKRRDITHFWVRRFNTVIKMSVLPILTCRLNTIPIKISRKGFPSGAVVGNLPADAGDTGSSPGPGGSHMPRGSWARVSQLLKPACLEPVLRSRRGHLSEKPVHRNGDPTQPKINK